MKTFDILESRVRSYIRDFPVVFDAAKGAHLYDESGKCYIDFLAGAGTLNYGHNHPAINRSIQHYLEKGGILHSLDKATTAKRALLETFHQRILRPRGLDYKVQFSGPTGTNAVEAALKLARIVKSRSNIIAFTNAFHGLSMGSLSVTGNEFYWDPSFGARSGVDRFPFDGYLGQNIDTSDYLRKVLSDRSSGIDLPAALIVETIQAEGGVNQASTEWLIKISRICKAFDILLIVDDIQVGNGRTGDFFSFEQSGIKPDIVLLSKSIGGGLPLSLVLIAPELDQWPPGKHTGTFRGNNLAFIAATAALETFWKDQQLSDDVQRKALLIKSKLEAMIQKYPQLEISYRGRGMIYGLEIPETGLAKSVCKKAFEEGVVIECCGSTNQVIKFLPSLVMDEKTLKQGIDIIDHCIGLF
ncbi:diaminobutyrate--2-oxoglutarate transaminase [Magnetococcales bacterium HHB-1]